MEKFLENKVAIVTGGGSGVGEAVCLKFARVGALVAVADIVLEKAERTKKMIEDLGGQALAIQVDVTRRDQVKAAADKVLTEFGHIDILINNAGLGVEKRFAKTDPEVDWPLDLGVNLYGVLNFTHAVIGLMIEQKSGKIVTTVSDAGRIGEPHLPVYSAAKAGAIGFSRALAKDVGKFGINVNCVALGATRTPLISDGLTPEREEQLAKMYPLRRIGEPEDPANAITFLASPFASFITGQVLPVNGGYSTC